MAGEKKKVKIIKHICQKCGVDIAQHEIPEIIIKAAPHLKETDTKKYKYGECLRCDAVYLIKIRRERE